MDGSTSVFPVIVRSASQVAASNGDHVYAAVLKQFLPLIRSVARGYQHEPIDREDLIQAGRIALWRAITTFDPARCCSLKHYATQVIVRAIYREVMRERRHWIGREEADLNENQDIENTPTEIIESVGTDGVSSEDELHWALLRAHLEARVRMLPRQLQQIYRMRYSNSMTQKEAATSLGITQQRVSQLEQLLLRRLCFES